MKYLVLSLTLLLFIASCATEEVCDDDNQSYMAVRFKVQADEDVLDTIMTEMSIYGIREGKADSLIYNTQSANTVTLPLDPNNDISRFVLSNELEQDTLTLMHSSEVYLINYTCGFGARFNLNETERGGSWMKKLEVRDSSVDAEEQSDDEHLWIYF